MLPFLMAAGAAMSMIGGAVGALGAQRAGADAAAAAKFKAQAEAGTLNYNAALDELSAKISDRDRVVAIQQSFADAYDTNRKNVAQMGQIRAAYGWSGLSVEGSPLDVLEATAVEQTMDVRKTLYAGQVVAAGLQDKANMARAHASLLRTQANNALIGGDMTASSALAAANYQSAASLISGVSGALRSYTPARTA